MAEPHGSYGGSSLASISESVTSEVDTLIAEAEEEGEGGAGGVRGESEPSVGVQGCTIEPDGKEGGYRDGDGVVEGGEDVDILISTEDIATEGDASTPDVAQACPTWNDLSNDHQMVVLKVVEVTSCEVDTAIRVCHETAFQVEDAISRQMSFANEEG